MARQKVEELPTEDICNFFNMHFKKQLIYPNNSILMVSTGDIPYPKTDSLNHSPPYTQL